MNIKILASLILGLSLAAPVLHAQTTKSKSTTKPPAKASAQKKTQKKAAQTKAGSKRTVGQLLQQADRGSSISANEKSSTALPDARLTLDAVPRNLNQVKPPRTATFLNTGTDDKVKLEKITDQQIAELFKLTQKFKNSPQRGELWLRLAELYVEKASIIELRKNEAYENALRQFNEKKGPKPTLSLSDAREYNKKALQLYEWFVRDFPKDEKIDQALFFLGYNNYEIGDLKKGTMYYERLTAEFPRSPYIMESNFALGEYYFENDKWASALKYYSEVTRNKRNRLYTFSLYKTAWCEFRMGDTQQALKLAEQLIRFSRQQDAQATLEGRKTINRARLENEGLRDIVLFYSEAGSPQTAVSYFQNLAGKDADSYLEKLAYLYGDKGNVAGSKTVFKYLIDKNPRSPKAFDFQYQIVKLFFNNKKSREFREEIFLWVKNFGEGSEWYQANANNAELVQNSYKLRETTLRNYVLQTHQTAQNSRAPFSQGLALEGYRLYIAEFGNSPVIGDLRFYFGELLYDMKKFEEAGAQYRWVVENAPKSKFYEKSAENVVISFEKDLPKDEEITAIIGKTTEPVVLDPRAERFISIGQWYLSKFPDINKAVEIKFRIGRLYYQHNQFEQAIPYFLDIVKKHPKTKYAEYSANLLLDIFNLKKDFAGLEKAAMELLAIPAIANSKAGQDIRGVLEKNNFKKAQDLEDGKDYAGSAAKYEAFAAANAGSDLALAATFNAAINYERAGKPDKALEAHAAILRSKDPKAKSFQGKSKRIVAKLYQDAGRLEEAAATYKVAAAEPENKALAANLLFNSAVLYEALGKNKESIQSYEAYMAENKKRDRFEAYYSIATMYRKQASKSKAIEYYKLYLDTGVGSAEKNVESAFHIHKLSKEIGRRTEADEWRKKTLSLQRKAAPSKKGPGARYAAALVFEDTLVSYTEMKAIQMPKDVAKQKAAAEKKIAMITKLNTELAEVIKYDSPDEIVGALTIVGEANYHMGQTFVNAATPPGLNAEQTAKYKETIAGIAEPFFAKSKESLKAALERGSELDTFTPYYDEARNLLAKIDPSAVYEGAEKGSDFRQGEWIGL